MAASDTSNGIISPALFDQYTAKWLDVVSQPDGSVLAQAFLVNGKDRLLFVGFPIKQITSLVSAVGVQKIKARFLLIPGADGQPHFSLALFATGVDDEIVSAYYVPDQYWTGAARTPVLGEPVPGDLAAQWMANWKAAPAVTSAQFAYTQGPLQGYNFDIKDFMTPLFAAQPFGDQQVRLNLGLHEYYAANSSGAGPTQTFGLVLRVYSAGQSVSTSDDGFYDMATPCPPTH
ncbi:hypothetical protein [Hymenobacter terricola]|uniref:hypothetical protein n=1 Tax=Hymenobacter terricola TaxID=2819236 RepID=UPI001B313071|nr:hypothetical protein [Hymenobacter terricola]